MRAFAREELGAAFPAAVANHLRDGAGALEACGFVVTTYAGLVSTQALTTATALLERADGAALAFIFAGEGKDTGVMTATTFQTKVDDGSEITTSNFAATMRTPSRPRVEGISFPDVKDAARLWAIHAFRVQHAAPNRATHMTRGSDPIGYQVDEERVVQDFWVQKSYYRRASDGRLHLTVTGAARAAWRGLWPWKQHTHSDQVARAAAVRRLMESF